jgi:hypothetical protein
MNETPIVIFRITGFALKIFGLQYLHSYKEQEAAFYSASNSELFHPGLEARFYVQLGRYLAAFLVNYLRLMRHVTLPADLYRIIISLQNKVNVLCHNFDSFFGNPEYIFHVCSHPADTSI